MPSRQPTYALRARRERKPGVGAREGAPESMLGRLATPREIGGSAGHVDRGAGVEDETSRRSRLSSTPLGPPRRCRRLPAGYRVERRVCSPRSAASTNHSSCRRRDLDHLVRDAMLSRRCHRRGHHQRAQAAELHERVGDDPVAAVGDAEQVGARPAGLVRGPRRLKIVRTASSLRTGTTWASPCVLRGEHEPKPTSSMTSRPRPAEARCRAERLEHVRGA